MGTRLAGFFAGVVLAATVVTGPATPTAADPVADFYRGKTVTFHVGAGVGSGADIATRMVARNLARHIPGRPTVIVKNMAGAGGDPAALQLPLRNCAQGRYRVRIGGSVSVRISVRDRRYQRPIRCGEVPLGRRAGQFRRGCDRLEHLHAGAQGARPVDP